MITRYQGNTHDLTFTLKKNKALIDLDEISSVEFSFEKEGTVITKTATKDVDSATGKVTVALTDSDVDTAGRFPYDIKIIWIDLKETTFIKSTFVIKSTVNP